MKDICGTSFTNTGVSYGQKPAVANVKQVLLYSEYDTVCLQSYCVLDSIKCVIVVL